jgi:23S rRNA (cytosine1962-C5)-methyltransferase
MVHIILKKGKEKPVLRGNPWVFSGAIASCEGIGGPGEMCTVSAADGGVIGHGYYNPHSSIAVRMLTAGAAPFDRKELHRRLTESVARRQGILDAGTNACRLVNSEGDFLPGLIIDLYGGVVCLQILTAGMERFRKDIGDIIGHIIRPSAVYERSDGGGRNREGLEKRNCLVMGTIPSPLHILENGLRFAVDLEKSQKTGLFLDQRENRQLVRRYAAGRRVADCFGYTGAFSVYALAGGALSAATIDSSAHALEQARGNVRLNGFDESRHECIEADVFSFLRQTSEPYSLIVLDPPKFAKSDRDVHRACRGYKDITLAALRLAGPDAVIFTFSCSQAIDAKLFRQVVFAASADSGRRIQLLHVLSQPPDHPVNIAHKEGEYLKGLVVRVAG